MKMRETIMLKRNGAGKSVYSENASSGYNRGELFEGLNRMVGLSS